jgi:hypothetical protein
VWFWDRGVSTEAAAHAALCPQPGDYDNFLAFRHALAAWYFAHPGDAGPDFPPQPPPNPVLQASPTLDGMCTISIVRDFSSRFNIYVRSPVVPFCFMRKRRTTSPPSAGSLAACF